VKRLPIPWLLIALLAPAAADEVIVGEMDAGCALPFCGG
jgi:hypothetical protein